MESVNFNIFILSSQIIDFCERNGITEEDLDKISKLNEAKNITNVNSFVDYYGIKEIDSPTTEDVYIKDVVGWDPCKKSRSLFSVLENCYSDGNETYKIRNNDKLRFSKDEMIKEMQDSLDYEPVWFNEIEGKKIVSINGCHRTSILKSLYLADKVKENQTEKELDEKYKIKAKVTKYDMTLTYIHYFLKQMGVISYMEMERDSTYVPTGKYKIDTPDAEKIMSKDEIIGLFNESLNLHADKIDTWSIGIASKIPSFKKFLKDYAPNLLKEEEYGSLS